MPAILDGYHWSKNPGSLTEEGAGAFFSAAETRLHLSGKPQISEAGSTLVADLPVGKDRVLHIRFEERKISCHLSPKTSVPLTLSFEWDPSKAALIGVKPQHVAYRWQDFDYGVNIEEGQAATASYGWRVTGSKRGIALQMAQRK